MPAIASGLKTLLAPTSEGSRIFPVVVKSDLYGPEYPEGSIAMIDPDLKPKDDDLVYAAVSVRG